MIEISNQDSLSCADVRSHRMVERSTGVVTGAATRPVVVLAVVAHAAFLGNVCIANPKLPGCRSLRTQVSRVFNGLQRPIRRLGQRSAVQICKEITGRRVRSPCLPVRSCP